MSKQTSTPEPGSKAPRAVPPRTLLALGVLAAVLAVAATALVARTASRSDAFPEVQFLRSGSHSAPARAIAIDSTGKMTRPTGGPGRQLSGPEMAFLRASLKGVAFSGEGAPASPKSGRGPYVYTLIVDGQLLGWAGSDAPPSVRPVLPTLMRLLLL